MIFSDFSFDDDIVDVYADIAAKLVFECDRSHSDEGAPGIAKPLDHSNEAKGPEWGGEARFFFVLVLNTDLVVL